MTTQEIDATDVQAAAGAMLGILNDGALALMTSIGHRTGLFDTLAGLPPASSEAIAEAAGLNERYVREWLGAMVTGGIVEHDSAARTYRLPPAQAAVLTRAAGTHNLAAFAQFISLVGDVESEIVESFQHGGGVPYAAFPRFQAVMAESSGAIFDAGLIDSTLPLVPGLVERLEAGLDVADIGCGRGRAINLIAQAFPRSRCTGYDFGTEAIAAARAEAVHLGLTNVRFEVQDVGALAATDAYDLITAFDAIHDQGQPATVLKNIAHALRPDGTFLMVDIAASSDVSGNLDHPLAPFIYTLSCMHCMTVSLAQGGDGLGAMWGEETARRMLTEAGFASVEVKRVEGDIINNYYIARKR